MATYLDLIAKHEIQDDGDAVEQSPALDFIGFTITRTDDAISIESPGTPSGTAPIVVTTGGSVPVISINPATGSTAGSFSASDKTKLDAATASATATTVALRDASGGCAFDDLTAVTLVASSSIKGPTQVSAIKTATYTAAIDEIVRVNPSGGAFDVDLPTAVGNAGRAVTVKNVTSSTTAVTVDPDGSETVDTAASYSLAVAYGTATFISDGANWMAFPPA
jgi:hypothetical protein